MVSVSYMFQCFFFFFLFMSSVSRDGFLSERGGERDEDIQ